MLRFDNSTLEVLFPGATDFIFMLLDDVLNIPEYMFAQSGFNSDGNRRLKPEFRLAVCTRYMDMHSFLFTGEKEKTVRPFNKHRRAHDNSIAS